MNDKLLMHQTARGNEAENSEVDGVSEAFIFLFAWKRTLAIACFLGLLAGVSYWLIMPRYYDSEFFLGIRRDDAAVLKDPVQITQSLVGMFSQEELALAFSRGFFESLDKQVATEAESSSAKRAKHAIAQEFGVSLDKVDPEVQKLVTELAAYLSGPMVRYLREPKSIPISGFLLLFNAVDGKSWRVQIRMAERETVRPIAKALAAAFTLAAKAYNEREEALIRQTQKLELADANRSLSDLLVQVKRASGDYELVRSKLKRGFFEIEGQVSGLLGRSRVDKLDSRQKEFEISISPGDDIERLALQELSDVIHTTYLTRMTQALTDGPNGLAETDQRVIAILQKLSELEAEQARASAGYSLTVKPLKAASLALQGAIQKGYGLVPKETFALAGADFKEQLFSSQQQRRRLEIPMVSGILGIPLGALSGLVIGLIFAACFDRWQNLRLFLNSRKVA